MFSQVQKRCTDLGVRQQGTARVLSPDCMQAIQNGAF